MDIERFTGMLALVGWAAAIADIAAVAWVVAHCHWVG